MTYSYKLGLELKLKEAEYTAVFPSFFAFSLSQHN